MANIFDIRDYIDLDDAGEPYTIFGETRNAIKFDTSIQLQHFINYLKDFIKFSISWEKPLTNLLKLCDILVKDLGLAKGRSLVIILASDTWVYCDDIAYAETELNVFNWVDFSQWQYYQMTQPELNDNHNAVERVTPDVYHCYNCGKPIIYTPGARFCIYCGTQLQDTFLTLFDNAFSKDTNDVDE